MDADYLKENVGDVLAKGVAETLLTAPDDPVDYLSKWLYKYVDYQKN